MLDLEKSVLREDEAKEDESLDRGDLLSESV